MLTDAGRLIYPGLHAGFESVRGAIAQLDRSRDSNVLVISATPGLVAKWLMPRLWRFLNAHPDIDDVQVIVVKETCDVVPGESQPAHARR